MTEQYLQFNSGPNTLSAILHPAAGDVGVLILVGGPQYRVGSHRQFVKLSRYLALQHIPSLRLDTCGMGDSSGEKAEFYQQDNDIDQAIQLFFQHCPQLSAVLLWGLCDAASAILIKLQKPDPRIGGVILLNPWVRQTQSQAQTMLKHYYWQRLFSRRFWQKLFGGGVKLHDSLSSLWRTIKASRQTQPGTVQVSLDQHNYVDAMLRGWQQFAGEVLLITSGEDLTAQEFLDLCQRQQAWRSCLHSAAHLHLADANHTFASASWRKVVEQGCTDFIRSRFNLHC